MSVPAPPGPGGRQQLPLALRYPPDQCFEAFVAASDATIAPLRALANGEGGESVYLVGASGSGKTHLALAACAAAERQGRTAAYIAPAAAAGRLREALGGLHESDFVAVDGLDAIAGHREDEVALFDFHNRTRDRGHAVVYTAACSPDALPLALPDLRSRLSQCTRVVLATLDDAGRREVLLRRARRRGLQVDAAAVDWLLRRTQRDLASLTALLDTLDRASLAAQRRITVPFLREVLDG
ncbi:DnaA regulatory inactivator Hda [Luteimonas vadosa]|uniref:DnaA regulatory inactivator Hda n=1 Tax=Luteimonas vadosa TaxID=1165507 RepID=A0ABP9DV90_9GAMM